MTFWEKENTAFRRRQRNENENTPAIFAKAERKRINQIGIDLWDTKIQPGLKLCAITGL